MAISLAANVLKKDSLNAARQKVNKQFGSWYILINGAGGNHPLGTTSNTYFLEDDLNKIGSDFKTFFDIDAEGVKFVFNLNFIGTLLKTEVFAKDMIEKKGVVLLIYPP